MWLYQAIRVLVGQAEGGEGDATALEEKAMMSQDTSVLASQLPPQK